MEIWLSTIGQRLDHAENTRTMLLASYLLERGHTVTLWTSAWDHVRKQWRDELSLADDGVWAMPSGLRVRFMRGIGYKRNVGPARLVDHHLAARDFRSQAKALKAPEIAIASLPDHITAEAMVAEGRRRGYPVIVDVRDKWPDIFFDHAPGPLKPLVRLGLVFESRRARRALTGATKLVAMMQSMIDWGTGKAGRPTSDEDRIFYLATTEPNLPDAAPYDELNEDQRRILDEVRGKTVFSFVGTFNRTQHPSLVLDAAEQMVSRGDSTEGLAILIGGDGLDGDDVRRRIAKLPFAHDVGWLRPPQMRAILASSDVGLLPLNVASEAFNNKAFAYLASGLPILNCALGDLAELIEAEGIGVNLPAADAEAMREAILALGSDRARVDRLKAKSRDLYDRAFDQRTIYNAYVDHIERTARDYPRG